MSFGCTVVLYNAETEFFVKSITSARFRNFVRFAPVAVAAIALAGCNQYTTAGDKSGLHN
jgi:hypothetical protein